ncbi:MAG: Flp pilus assembly protein CpaB [Bdellovibrionales bacterium]|nr:Flp pilus assembly protein CpaB [Bdellovibrionales bacterium]
MAIRKNSRKKGGRKVALLNFFGLSTLSFAIVCAAFLLKNANASTNKNDKLSTPIVAQFDIVKVPVPVEPVSAGIKLSTVKFKKISYPAHQVPLGAIRDLSSYADAVTLAKIPANIPVFKENLTFSSLKSNPVIDQIPNGMRAMTIKVDATTAVEGWASSGSIVDVLLVEKEKTTVVAEKVKILSAERSVTPVEQGESPKLPTTVTMLVTQEQCLAINTAIPRGKIAFALRSSDDNAAWQTTYFTSDHLKNTSRTLEQKEEINGVLMLKEHEKAVKSFALAGGKWIPTEVVPEGFFVADRGGR